MQPGWDITSEWLECPVCHHIILHSQELGKTSTPCPQCGKPGTRILYPGYPEVDLIHMAAYFFEQGEKRRIANQAEQLEEALLEIGKQYNSEYLKELATELSQRFNGSADPVIDEQMLRDSLNYLMSHLNISFDQATRVWHPLMGSAKVTFEEHKATVLMACGAFESMFLNLLIHLGIWRGGLDPREAERIVERLGAPGKTYGQFEKWASCSIDEIAGQIGYSAFWENWRKTRTARNKFMHGIDDPINRGAAIEAFELLPQLVAFFAALNNFFIPKTP